MKIAKPSLLRVCVGTLLVLISLGAADPARPQETPAASATALEGPGARSR